MHVQKEFPISSAMSDAYVHWGVNVRKMSVYLWKRIDEIAKATSAEIAPPTAPSKGPYDGRVYQTTHVTGGTIMGSGSGTSIVSPRLQHRDAENLFVVGASGYSFNAGYNPTGPLRALALRLGDDLNDYFARRRHLLIQFLKKEFNNEGRGNCRRVFCSAHAGGVQPLARAMLRTPSTAKPSSRLVRHAMQRTTPIVSGRVWKSLSVGNRVRFQPSAIVTP
jgi:hypothetical protein